MHLIIINCSPRVLSNSNTNIILQNFIAGYTKNGNTVELFHLSQKGKWNDIQQAFAKNSNILMALPLYVECVPGIMMEFLETLTPKSMETPKTKLSFLLQGGFPEGSQYRCCEQYLQRLPALLGCEYGGALLKGNMFMTHIFTEEMRAPSVSPFSDMGEAFAQDGSFIKEKADKFAAPEFFSKPYRIILTVVSPLQKIFFNLIFKKNGCQGKLTDRPYQKYLN